MTTTHQFRALVSASLLWTAAMLAVPVQAQESVASSSSIFTNVRAMPAGLIATPSHASWSNAFTKPGSDQPRGDDNSDGDSLMLQVAVNRMFATTQFSFAAEPGFYKGEHGEQYAATPWSSSLASTFTTYLNGSGTTALRTGGSFDYFGEQRQFRALRTPATRSLTFDWNLVHAVPSRFGSLEIAAGMYREKILSYSAGPNELTNVLFDYSANANGVETSLSLPDHNLSFSLRFGEETLGSRAEKFHSLALSLSWGW